MCLSLQSTTNLPSTSLILSPCNYPNEVLVSLIGSRNQDYIEIINFTKLPIILSTSSNAFQEDSSNHSPLCTKWVQKEEMPQTIIFCKTFNDIANVVSYLLMNLRWFPTFALCILTAHNLWRQLAYARARASWKHDGLPWYWVLSVEKWL